MYKILSVFIIFFLSICYCFSANTLKSQNFVDKSLEIREITPIQQIDFTLPQQDYFLKIKFLGDPKQLLTPAVYFNNYLLQPTSQKVDTDYIKLYFRVKKELIAQKNSLIIHFEGKVPQSFHINLANFYKRLTQGIVIFSRESTLSSDGHFFRKLILSFFILLIVWRVLVSVFALFLSGESAYTLSTICFIPFIFLNISLFIPRLFGFKVFVSPFVFWFTFFVLIFITSIVLIGRQAIILLKRSFSFKSYRIFIMAFLWLIPFLFFFCAGELITRTYIHFNHPVSLFRPSNNDLSYELNPNANLDFSGAQVSISPQGFRGKTFFVQKPSETLRIVFLGDSMVFGFGVKDNETLPEQLSVLLNQHQKTEVINLAVTGYNSTQELQTFIKRGLQLRPDILVLGVCLNDIGGSIFVSTGFNTLLEIGNHATKYQEFSVFDKLQYHVLKTSYFVQYLVFKWRRLYEKLHAKKNGYSDFSIRLLKGDLNDELNRALENFKKDIVEYKRICDNNNIELVITVYTTDIQLDHFDLQWTERWLKQVCLENSIDFVDYTSVFQGKNKDEVFIDHGHPSAFGNSLIAAYLFEHLRSKYSLQ